MVIAPAARPTTALGLGILLGILGLSASGATAQSANWSSEIIQLQPAELDGVRPVVVAVALDPAGRRLAIAGDDHAIRVWDVAERRVIQRLVGHTDWVRSLAYSSDGGQLASTGNDGCVLLWTDASSRPQRELLSGDEALAAVAFRPGTSQLAAVGFHQPLRFFDAATGALLSELKCPCVDMRAIAFSPTNNLMAGGGRNGKIRIWNPESGEVRGDYPAHRQRIRDLRFSPDGVWLASCGEDRRVRVAAVDESREFNLPLATAKVMALAFVGPDRLATGGSDDAIRLWDLGTQQEVDRLSGHTGSVMALAYRGGTLVSAGFDATVRIWRPRISASSDAGAPTTRVGKLELFEIR